MAVHESFTLNSVSFRHEVCFALRIVKNQDVGLATPPQCHCLTAANRQYPNARSRNAFESRKEVLQQSGISHGRGGCQDDVVATLGGGGEWQYQRQGNRESSHFTSSAWVPNAVGSTGCCPTRRCILLALWGLCP